MNIIIATPNASGAYPSIQTWGLDIPPNGYYQIAEICDTSAMHTHAGFVTLTVENNIVTAITGDDAKYQAWLASLPVPDTTQPISLENTVRAQNATITMMASVMNDMQSDLEALKS